MSVRLNRIPIARRRVPALLLIVGSGALLLCGGGWIFLVPAGVSASKTVEENKTTLTHAERVVLTAERMHQAQYRAAPDDSMDTQMRNAVFGDHGLRSPHSRVDCEWMLHAFGDERCSLQLEAGGRWSDNSARVVFSEFLQFARSLCPDAAMKVRPLVHYARDKAPQETEAGGYRVRVTLYEQDQSTEAEWWQMVIELWPLH